MTRNLRITLSVLLSLVFLFSVGKLIAQQQDAEMAEEADRMAQELLANTDSTVGQMPEQFQVLPVGVRSVLSGKREDPRKTTAPVTEPPRKETVWVPAPVTDDDPYLEELVRKGVVPLQEVNPDVLGWIWIPGTVVDYPLMQGMDNEYYLYRTWTETYSSYGSIFLECRNSGDLSDFNTIIYGHNMKNGSMFATLRNYAEDDYFRMFPYVYILTDAGVFRYEIFATYEAKVDSNTYQLSFKQQESRERFIQSALERAEYDTGIQPAVTDRILTLSTCTGWGDLAYRRVVHARLAMVEVEVE